VRALQSALSTRARNTCAWLIDDTQIVIPSARVHDGENKGRRAQHVAHSRNGSKRGLGRLRMCIAPLTSVLVCDRANEVSLAVTTIVNERSHIVRFLSVRLKIEGIRDARKGAVS
jgi:hypothetical protein